jgi:predicted 3-demethylubiquinone-9 3-methyltransferase (glyoxalase superfamily)
MASLHTITPCLWFDSEAEEAAKLYVSLFPNSSIDSISRYGKEGHEIHHQPEGKVLTVAFKLDGAPFTALNGGPQFKFSEAISFQVYCDTQAEIDRFWNALTSEGGKESQCGWLKDKFGLSWQIIPRQLGKLLSDPDRAKAERVTKAFLKMRKFDLAAIESAAAGK